MGGREVYKKKIAAGAKLLDRVQLGWPRLINLSSLDMGDPDNCVLTQLFGNYFLGLATILGQEDFELGPGTAVTLGFELAGVPTNDPRYAQLTAEWRAFLKGVLS